MAQTTGVGRRHVRKVTSLVSRPAPCFISCTMWISPSQLLVLICGSKEKYRLTRDVHALKSFMKTTRLEHKGLLKLITFSDVHGRAVNVWRHGKQQSALT